MTEEGLSIPPSFYEPLPPSGPRKQHGVVIAAVVISALMGLVVLSVAFGIRNASKERRQERRDFAAAAAQMRAKLQLPPDTDKLTPARDGTIRWDSPAPDDGSHGYHVTLPKGWAGHHVAVSTSETVFVDSVLSRPALDGSNATLTVERIDGGRQDLDSEEFQSGFREGLASAEGAAIHITSRYLPTQVGEEQGRYFDGTKVDDGGQVRMRVIAFQHGGEMFFVFFRATPKAWDALLPELQRLLATWRWG